MSETPAHLALVETASALGVEARKRFLVENGPREFGWSYRNVLKVRRRLKKQISSKGFFRLYLYIPDFDSDRVRYWMKVTNLKTYDAPQLFSDPADGHRYLVHSRMLIDTIGTMETHRELSTFRSADIRKPDPRHLELGFLFVVDPEV